MIDRLSLPSRYRRMVEALLSKHVPEAEVWAYGSRVNGESHEGSDLDLVVRSPSLESLGTEFLDLIEAVRESNIPILVQAHDWAGLPKRFHQEIERDYVVVQEGAKHTAAGEWRETIYGRFSADSLVDSLSNLCVTRSGIQTGPFGSQLHQRDYVPVGTPIITVEHLGQNRITTQDLPYVSDCDRVRLSRYALQEGDIVFSRVGSVDRRALVRKEEEGWLFSGRCLRVRPDSRKIDSGYLSYFFGLATFQEYVRSIAVGATMPSLNTKILSDVPIVYPPLPTQRAIAHVLGTLDDKIELNRRMNETLESMARAIFQDWFVDFGPTRAKMEGRAPYLPPEVWSLFPERLADSELGPIPEGWGVRGLGEVVELLRDQENPLSSPETVFSHFSIPAFDDGRMPKQEQGENIKSAKSRVPPGVILLSKLNPDIERVWLTDVESGERAVCSTEFLVLRPRQPFGTCFVYCLGRSPAFRQQLGSLVTGTSKSHQRAPAEAVLALPTVLPSKPVIHKFERFTQAILGKTQMNQRESHTLAALRDALLPRLVLGEVGHPTRKVNRGDPN